MSTKTHTWKFLDKTQRTLTSEYWIAYLLSVLYYIHYLFKNPSMQEILFKKITVHLHLALQQTFFPIHILCYFKHKFQLWNLPMNKENTHSKKLGTFQNASFTLIREGIQRMGHVQKPNQKTICDKLLNVKSSDSPLLNLISCFPRH